MTGRCLAGWILALGWVFPGHAAPLAPPKPPNILFIMSDDHTAQAIGAYGGRLAKLDPTPTIDRLAREGMLFENCFCNNAICTPSRASIMTGQYPMRNGVRDLNQPLPPARQHLATAMRAAGYTTAIIGKWHLTEEPATFDHYCVLPGQGKYFNPDFRIRGDKPWPENVLKTEGHSSDVITGLALDWLRQQPDVREAGKPFFLMLHYKAPHDLFEYAPRYASYLADIDVPEPDNLRNQPGPYFGSVATRGENDELVNVIGSSVGKRNRIRNYGKHFNLPQDLPEEAYIGRAYQLYLKKYLRCVKGVDDNLARLFAELEHLGLMDRTVILYTGDQGFFLGEHDFIDKRWMYEEALRMPLLVRYPPQVKAGSRCDWLVNNCDFAPTMVALAGGAPPAAMQGYSFAAALRGEPRPPGWRTAVYYRYWMHMAHRLNNPAHFGLRTDRYKLIFFYGTDWERNEKTGENRFWPDTPAAWELYDLQADPHEMTNVYGRAAYRSVAEDLKRQLITLRETLEETDDDPRLQAIIEKHWND